WEYKLVQTLWKTVWSTLQKLKIELPYDPVILILGIYPRITKTPIQKKIYAPSYLLQHYLLIAKSWNPPKCPLIDEWSKKMWHVYVYIHTMEYYSAIKKNEILLSATTWMELESIVLSEISQ
ncbi:LORF2 protein, partial [Crocuta crocuta]